jgi:hypothetical protein
LEAYRLFSPAPTLKEIGKQRRAILLQDPFDHLNRVIVEILPCQRQLTAHGAGAGLASTEYEAPYSRVHHGAKAHSAGL